MDTVRIVAVAGCVAAVDLCSCQDRWTEKASLIECDTYFSCEWGLFLCLKAPKKMKLLKTRKIFPQRKLNITIERWFTTIVRVRFGSLI